MADRKIPPIKYENLHEYLCLIKRYGFEQVYFILNSLMHLNPKEIRDLRQSFAESSYEYEEPPCVCEEIPDVDVDVDFTHMPNLPWDLKDGLPQSHIDALNEPLPNLGDPDEESHDDDEHFDQEAWDRFLSEENHQRYG